MQQRAKQEKRTVVATTSEYMEYKLTMERGQQKSQLKAARTARELKDKFKVSVVEDQTLKGQIGGQEGGALDKIIPKTSVSCIVADCQFRMEQVDEITAKRVLKNHVFVAHRQQTQTHLQQRKG